MSCALPPGHWVQNKRGRWSGAVFLSTRGWWTHLPVLTCLCFVSLQLYLQRLKRTSDKLNCEKSLWEGTDQCKIPTKGWEQDDYMHIRPKSSFSHCRAGDCSELSHMLVLFIYLDLFFTCFSFLKKCTF